MSRYDDPEIDAFLAIDQERGRAGLIAMVAWVCAIVAAVAAMVYLADGPRNFNGDPAWAERIVGVQVVGLSVALVVALLLGLSAIVGLLAVRADGEVRDRLILSEEDKS